MDTIEELGRRAAAAALADAAAAVDPDDGLRRIRDDVGTVIAAPGRRQVTGSTRRWTIGVSAVAAVIAAVVTGVVVIGDDDSQQLGPDPTPSGPPIASSVPAPSTFPVTVAPSAAPSTVVPSTRPPVVTEGVRPPASTAAPSTAPSRAPVRLGSPSARTEELGALAGALGAGRLAVEFDGGLTVWRDGSAVDIATGARWQWIDGEYIYAQVGLNAERFLALEADGTVICDGEGRIQRVRRRPDGTYVATVLRDGGATFTSPDLEPIPTFAVDCATGDGQPIAPGAWAREAGGQETIYAGGRSFTATFDAEGNANVVNDAGVSINGQDYAGYHAFSEDGSIVAYGDMTTVASPHVSTRVRVRSTGDGSLLSSVDVPEVFNRVWVWQGRVAVAHPPTDVPADLSVRSITVFDLATGAAVATVPPELRVVFVG